MAPLRAMTVRERRVSAHMAGALRHHVPMFRRIADRLDALPRAALPAAVGVVALLLRLWVLVDQRADNPLYTLAILDDRTYLDLAAAVRDASDPQPWFLAPLHPWVLGLVSSAPTMLTASFVNLVAGTLTAVAAAWAARDLHSSAAGWVTGALVAGAGTFVFHDTLPGQEALLGLPGFGLGGHLGHAVVV